MTQHPGAVPPHEPGQVGGPYPQQPGAGQPPYGAPGYGAPGYAPLPPGGQPAYRSPDETDGFAIAAFALSLVGGVVLAVFFAIVALVRIRPDRTRGKGLAVAALVISALWVVAVAGLLVFAIMASPDRDDSGTITHGGSAGVGTLRAGACLADVDPKDSSLVFSVDQVPCTQVHNAQVIGEFRLPEGPYPGEEAITEQAESKCWDLMPSKLGGVDPDSLSVFYLYPRPTNWRSHDRTVTCLAVSDGDPLTHKLG